VLVVPPSVESVLHSKINALLCKDAGGISKLMSFQASTREKNQEQVAHKDDASMKVQLAALFVWTAASTDAFVVHSKAFVRSTDSSCLSATIEFDYLLNENGANQASTTTRSQSGNHYRITTEHSAH
jgi:hypothetical protein